MKANSHLLYLTALIAFITPFAAYANLTKEVTSVSAKIDGQFHEFELTSACNVIPLPLEKKNATLVIKTAANTKDFVLTSIPFKTCEDIVSLHYPAQSIHQQEKIALSKEYTIFASNYSSGVAYLYLLPAAEGSVKVNLSVSPKEVIPTPEKKDENVSKYSKSGLLKIVGSIFVIAAVGFFGLVCYYRHHYKNYNVKPFNVPTWCPNFLFPKKENQLAGKFISLEPTGFKDNEYEPPIPVL